MRLCQLLFYLILINACSSGPSLKEGAAKNSAADTTESFQEGFSAAEEQIFSGISDSDFSDQSVVEYDKFNDFYPPNPARVLSQETLLGTALSSNENSDSEDLSTAAMKKCYLGQFDQGLSIFFSQYRKLHKLPNYWNQMGNCFALKGEFLKANLYYNKALEFDKNYAPALNNLGIIYLKNGQIQQGLETFKKARDQNPYSLTPLFNMAQLYLMYGHHEKAKEIFQNLHRKNRSDPEVLIALATAHLFSEEYELARNYFEELPSEFQKNPTAAINHSLTYLSLGMVTEAKAVFSQMNTTNLNSWTDYYHKLRNELRKRR